MNGPLVGTLCIFFVSSLLVNEVASECCPNFNGICRDSTVGTPYCGYGPCNVFGCNCDGGCRKKAGRMGTSVTDGFGAIDANSDGKVTLAEAKAIIAVENLPRAAEEFARMDLDFDGFLSREEINA